MSKSGVGHSILFYFKGASIHVQNLDSFEIAMERELSLVFLVLLIVTLRAVDFFSCENLFYWKYLEHSKMLLFGEAEKPPLDLILPSIMVHIFYSIRDERAELHLKCSSGN